MKSRFSEFRKGRINDIYTDSSVDEVNLRP